MITTVSVPTFRFSTAAPALAPAPSAPAPAPNPAPQTLDLDSVVPANKRVVAGVGLGAVYSGVMSAGLCGAAYGIASLAGLPFFSLAVCGAAVAAAAVVGGAGAGIMMHDSLSAVPAGTEATAAAGRDGFHKYMPDVKRDRATMILAGHKLVEGLNGTAKAATYEAAEAIGENAGAPIGMILGHATARTTGAVLGFALGFGAAGSPLLGVPLGLLGAAVGGYALDFPGHLLGTAVGQAVGSQLGREIHETNNPE